MKTIFLFAVLLGISITGNGQQKYEVISGVCSFVSDAPLELIKAQSAEVKGLIDPANSTFAFQIQVRTFRGFNSELQREHFNEKYMESDQFQTARFTGKIIEKIDYVSGEEYTVRAKGDLDIHGVKQSRIIRAKLKVEGERLYIDADFTVPLNDHNITIPNIVNQKIATEIMVNFKVTLALRS